ncbi:MAG TPA: heparan-alpha-glucosaminide N-acetyltransferase domain-containing protein [Actinopolymorphaceae bacterium]
MGNVRQATAVGAETDSTAATGAPPRRAARRSRLTGVDAARGVALIGMMAVHVLPSETFDGDRTVYFAIAGGRSAAAFAVLAGVGLALWSGGDRPRFAPGATSALVIRALAIGAIGGLLGMVDSGLAVILPYYALLFLFAVPLIRLRARTLAAIAAGVALVVPVVGHLVRPWLPALGDGNLLAELTLTGYYPALAWLTYLCAGLAVGRLALRSARTALGLLVGGALLALAAWAVSSYLLEVAGGRERLAATTGLAVDSVELQQRLTMTNFGTTPTDSWWWLASMAPHSSTTFDLVHTTGTALALLGAALLVGRAVPRLVLPLAAAGSIPLTLYSAHVLVVQARFVPADPEFAYAWQAGVALAFATAWRWTGRRGPLEGLVTGLSNLARRPAVRP